ncbi:MAG: ADP-ribosylglycohydrolase family protein [Gammaproteobacteria bacterium]|nr:ADP-ribosylglycohydrolase family protein [Gammaproteobacteria bacterium]
MGALIGDALGLGCHWYYDLDEMRRDCGAWVDGYLTPRPGRYHEGMRAGEPSQSAILLRMLLHSVLAHGEYSEADFTRRLDEDLFPQLDGTPFCGPGGYTNQSIREAWRRRVREGRSWQDCAGHADTTEGAERAIVLAALHARRPRRVAEAVSSHVALTQGDEAITSPCPPPIGNVLLEVYRSLEMHATLGRYLEDFTGSWIAPGAGARSFREKVPSPGRVRDSPSISA